SVSPIKDASGKIVGASAIARDITERRRRDERLKELAAMLDKAQDAILIVDMQQRVTYWNRRAERLYGWSVDEALGKSNRGLLYSEDTGDFDRAMAAVLANGEWTGELRHATRNARQLIVEARWTLVRDDEGKPTSILAINTDISEQKKIETQFLRAQRME